MNRAVAVEDTIPLVLGWRVPDGEYHPTYWKGADPRPGKQSRTDLETALPKQMQQHTLLLAPSGSGKSVFLGRIIEELAIKTHARFVVLDPNADFRRINKVKRADLWDKPPSYDLGDQLPHEPSQIHFSRLWERLRFEVLTARRATTSNVFRHLNFSWPSLPDGVLLADLPDLDQVGLSDCHLVFRSLARLASVKAIATAGEVALDEIISDFTKLLDDGDGPRTPKLLEEKLKKSYPVEELAQQWHELSAGRVQAVRDTVTNSIPMIVSARWNVTAAIERAYLARLKQFQRYGLTLSYCRGVFVTTDLSDVSVVDLTTIRDQSQRILVVSAMLAAELSRARRLWEEALTKDSPDREDNRPPTFIVVDEAHNLISRDPSRNAGAVALRDQFRTIAAEGRKFGLFLMLATQRPDKLDEQLLSECGNVAILRHESPDHLSASMATVGLQRVSNSLKETMGSRRRGLVLLAGPWAARDGQDETARVIYGAARRTEEGGRDLKPKLWGVPRNGFDADLEWERAQLLAKR